MNILILKGFNNYFNRIVKKYTTLEDYEENSQSSATYTDINFNPNDGVATELILGTGVIGSDADFEITHAADYLICYNTSEGVDTIDSRWFILECERTRAGQYKISLKRDVIADYLDDVKSAPLFLEKATIRDTQNPLLYNSENYNVNQIKTSETLIKDRSGVAWIVGYVSSKLSTETKDVQVTTVALNSSGVASGSFVYTVSSGYTSIYITYGGTNIYSGDSRFTATFNATTGIITYSINNPNWASRTVSMRVIYTAISPISTDNYKTTIPGDESRAHLTDAPYDMFAIPFGAVTLNSAAITTTKEAALEIAFEFAKDLGKDSIYDIQLLPYCPRQDMLLTGRVVESFGTSGIDYNYIYDSSNTIKSIMLWCTKSSDSFIVEPDSPVVINRELGNETSRQTAGSDGIISRTSLSNTNASLRITNNLFKQIKITGITSLTASKGSATDSISTFTSFTQNEDTGVLIINYTGTSFATGTQSGVTYSVSFKAKDYVNPEYLDYKISNECDVYRLVSPNYSGQFEWSLAKSSGSSNTFDVDFTYKPFQPYIHLSPIMAKLYGQDFNDARGLICGGDFSMPIITDAWTEYQVHNKTYQDVFDRQIKNMDVQNIIAGEQAAIQTVTGPLTGAIAGGMAGGKIGGAYGAVGGAVAGGGLTLAGGIADYNNLLKLQQENRSFAFDMFNYGLQNVQALPYGLTKVAAYTQNNKIFPMVEYYTCSDIEKQAFKEKLKYNGMSVLIVTTINDYLDSNEQRFYKGQIIRLPSIAEDSHLANEIYNEINKGVYM